MTVSYNPWLVILSGIIAMLSGYVMLEIGSQATRTVASRRNVWLLVGAGAMGMGIWAMHFIAMLAFSIPAHISYNFLLVAVSLLVAAIACWQGLFIVSRPAMSGASLIAGSVCMGLAIAGMHYIGMAAMNVAADIVYNPTLVILSLAIAIIVSGVAMEIAFGLRHQTESTDLKWKIPSAVVMGFAVLSMHYTGMSAAIFTPNQSKHHNLSVGLDNYSLGLLVGTITFIILGLTLFIAYINSGKGQTNSQL
jgi:NO-binding membrane sensor protein with MHYT domain